jgi:hypothetical protein
LFCGATIAISQKVNSYIGTIGLKTKGPGATAQVGVIEQRLLLAQQLSATDPISVRHATRGQITTFNTLPIERRMVGVEYIANSWSGIVASLAAGGSRDSQQTTQRQIGASGRNQMQSRPAGGSTIFLRGAI